MIRHEQMSFVVAVILTLSSLLSSSGARAQNRPNHVPTNRVVYLRGPAKVYSFLPAYNIHKTMDQMKAEATSGRQAFRNFYMGQVPQQGGIDPRFLTPVKDQGHRGTCVAFASLGLLEILAKQNPENSQQNVSLSEQYVYWANKELSRINPNADGSDPLEMLKTIDRYGAPSNMAWPYDTEGWWADQAGHPDCYAAYRLDPVNMNVPTQCVTNGAPPDRAKRAEKMRARGERAIPTSPEWIIPYIKNNVPVEIGVDVYASAWHMDNPGDIENQAKIARGEVDMPKAGDMPVGGHAVLIVGYSLSKRVYYIKNSWGVNEWAKASSTPFGRGYGSIPIDYVRQFGEAAVAQLSPVKAP